MMIYVKKKAQLPYFFIEKILKLGGKWIDLISN